MRALRSPYLSSPAGALTASPGTATITTLPYGEPVPATCQASCQPSLTLYEACEANQDETCFQLCDSTAIDALYSSVVPRPPLPPPRPA